jgi:hypothetical protein
MKAVAAPLEGRHRAPHGLTEPRGPTRGVGACARPIPYAQAVGPGPGIGPAALAAHRRNRGGPSPICGDKGGFSPIRRGGTRTGAPGLMSPAGGGPPEGGPPGGAALRFRPALIPLLREGGARLCQPWHLYVQKPLSAACLPAGPPAEDLAICRWPQSPGEGRAAGKYVAASLPLLGQVRKFPVVKSTKNRHRLGRSSP